MARKPDWLVVRRPGSPVLFLICMLTITVGLWFGQRQDCLRANGVRAGDFIYYSGLRDRSLQRAVADTGLKRALDLAAAAAAGQSARFERPLDCRRLLAPTRP